MPKRMDPRALRALIKADEFEMVRSSPWPSSISEMIAKGWSYPNGENFTPEAWAVGLLNMTREQDLYSSFAAHWAPHR
jgi:hypothetical protein